MTKKLPIVIDEVLRFRESSSKFIRLFKKLKHNEHLCPAVERQANRIIDCFLKFHSIAYDVQGINDRGSDVVLRYSIDSEFKGSISRYISFQIKSYDDMTAKSYLKDLKSQCFEAKGEYGDSLEQYYVLICTDDIEHKNKIRQIKKAFATSEYTTVVDPGYMATFLRLNPIRISSIVSTLLRDDDIIYKKASQDLSEYTPTEIAICIAVVLQLTISSQRRFDISRIAENESVREIYSKLPDYPRDYYFYLEQTALTTDDDETEGDLPDSEIREYDDRKRDFNIRFAEDVDIINEVLFSFDAASGMVEVDLEWARPLQAVMLDGMVRYDCRGDSLLRYVFASLGIMERFGYDDMEEEGWPGEISG